MAFVTPFSALNYSSHRCKARTCAAQEYQDIFEDHESFREYVYSISQDKRIKITPWTPDSQGAQRRLASYWLPLDAPEWFKKTTGTTHCTSNEPEVPGRRISFPGRRGLWGDMAWADPQRTGLLWRPQGARLIGI